MEARITLADVAARAGLSPTAASLILNGRSGTGLSEDARRRVEAAAEELGYRPNLAARALRMKKSATIGFVSDMVSSTRHAGPLIRGALHQARELDHTVLVVETEGDADEQARAIETLLDRKVDGLILASARGDAVDPDLPPLSVPVLLLNSVSATGTLPSVIPDEYEGGRAAAAHLIRSRDVATVHVLGADAGTATRAETTSQVRRRLAGISSVLDAAGVSAVYLPTEGSAWTPDKGFDAMHEALRRHEPVSALLCLNDPLAFGAYQAIHEAGLAIPGDVAIVSFDDDDLIAYLRPRLTTTALPFEAMGRVAVRLLLGGELDVLEHVEPMPLLIRESTRD